MARSRWRRVVARVVLISFVLQSPGWAEIAAASQAPGPAPASTAPTEAQDTAIGLPAAPDQPTTETAATTAATTEAAEVLFVAGSATVTGGDGAIRERLAHLNYGVTVKTASAVTAEDATG